MLVMNSRCAYPVPTLSSVPFQFVPLNNLYVHLKDNFTTSVPTGDARTEAQTGANIHKYLVKELRLFKLRHDNAGRYDSNASDSYSAGD
jgi:hypothetical protein